MGIMRGVPRVFNSVLFISYAAADCILLNGTAINSTAIHLEWWFGHRMAYRVQCTETHTGRELLPNVTNNTSIIIGGLHPYTNYSCNVSAAAIDETNSSYLINVTTQEDGTHFI